MSKFNNGRDPETAENKASCKPLWIYISFG
jgi:hypothetical protein